MIFGENSEKVTMHIGKAAIEESDEETLLGIKLDRKLCFKTHVQSLCRNASQNFDVHGFNKDKTDYEYFSIVTFQLLP